jgi:AAA+ superfamily predicted ATPase
MITRNTNKINTIIKGIDENKIINLLNKQPQTHTKIINKNHRIFKILANNQWLWDYVTSHENFRSQFSRLAQLAVTKFIASRPEEGELNEHVVRFLLLNELPTSSEVHALANLATAYIGRFSDSQRLAAKKIKAIAELPGTFDSPIQSFAQETLKKIDPALLAKIIPRCDD